MEEEQKTYPGSKNTSRLGVNIFRHDNKQPLFAMRNDMPHMTAQYAAVKGKHVTTSRAASRAV
jgi:hypothetical protein